MELTGCSLLGNGTDYKDADPGLLWGGPSDRGKRSGTITADGRRVG